MSFEPISTNGPAAERRGHTKDGPEMAQEAPEERVLNELRKRLRQKQYEDGQLSPERELDAALSASRRAVRDARRHSRPCVSSFRTVGLQSPETTLSSLIIEIDPRSRASFTGAPTRTRGILSEGEARMTVFDDTSKARTFNYTAGDVDFVPGNLGHYIENSGNTTVR